MINYQNSLYYPITQIQFKTQINNNNLNQTNQFTQT